MNDNRKVKLLIDALFQAQALTEALKEAHKRGLLVWGDKRSDKLIRITGKAWARYRRRREWFATS